MAKEHGTTSVYRFWNKRSVPNLLEEVVQELTSVSTSLLTGSPVDMSTPLLAGNMRALAGMWNDDSFTYINHIRRCHLDILVEYVGSLTYASELQKSGDRVASNALKSFMEHFK